MSKFACRINSSHTEVVELDIIIKYIGYLFECNVEAFASVPPGVPEEGQIEQEVDEVVQSIVGQDVATLLIAVCVIR